ncbi:hypothetical protein Micbo1qcDRAFT_63950 [Microdochium bolleyi]|uniref:Uncharacterized protein n=1 Tax=Microdochium bolleyi TaxID=196109 RepID=A0A136J2E8_9PEZI|nr:hypothetical protein Micbo1qcDRAFT_63950 [Microdochium bolleyi]
MPCQQGPARDQPRIAQTAPTVTAQASPLPAFTRNQSVTGIRSSCGIDAARVSLRPAVCCVSVSTRHGARHCPVGRDIVCTSARSDIQLMLRRKGVCSARSHALLCDETKQDEAHHAMKLTSPGCQARNTCIFIDLGSSELNHTQAYRIEQWKVIKMRTFGNDGHFLAGCAGSKKQSLIVM